MNDELTVYNEHEEKEYTMTYGKFFITYAIPSEITDEQAREGCFYSMNVFMKLNQKAQDYAAELFFLARDVMDKKKIEFDPTGKLWVMCVLSTIAIAMSMCCKEEGFPAAHEEIPRQTAPSFFSTNLVDAKKMATKPDVDVIKINIPNMN